MIQAGAVVLDKHHIAVHEVRLRLQLLQLPGLLLQEYRVLRQRRLRGVIFLAQGLQILLRLIADEPASERLLNASAVMAIEPDSTPAVYLPANSSTFRNMPNRLHSVPYAARTAALPYSVRFFINIFDNKLTKTQFLLF